MAIQAKFAGPRPGFSPPRMQGGLKKPTATIVSRYATKICE